MNSQEFSQLCKECNKPISCKKAAIIMAGGKGTRMGDPNKHKCIFEIDGEPAIYPLLKTLRQADILTNVLVVGALSEQIMDVVSRKYPDCIFAFQTLQKGTGNAGKHGTYPLKQVGFQGDVFVLAGDSYVEKRALDKLYRQFKEENADMALLTKNVQDVPKAGRIVKDESGNVIGSVEFWDTHMAIAIKKMQNLLGSEGFGKRFKGLEKGSSDLEISEMLERINYLIESCDSILLETLESPRKIKSIFPKLSQYILNWKDKSAGTEWGVEKIIKFGQSLISDLKNLSATININGKEYDAQDIEDSTKEVNISVYLFKSSVLYKNIDKILSENAQNEEYLTDIVQILSAQKKKIISVQVDKPNDVMSFNDPEELAMINTYIEEKKDKITAKKEESSILNSSNTKTVDEWQSIFEKSPESLIKHLSSIYGNDEKLINSKISQYLQVLDGYSKKFSPLDEVFIVRSPGRINLMGRHIDHRGGNVNMMAINREMIFVVSPRNDDLIIAYNKENTKFPAFSFSIGENLMSVDWEDWMDFISDGTIIDMIRNSQGNWVNYLKAAALRLQVHTHSVVLNGANIYASGDIPQAAGLSSSSALVVATLETLISINNLQIHARDFIDLCGEGEWFVGTRGGSADHAAIKVSEHKKITQIGFFPFEIKDSAELPDDLDLVVINSKIKADKSNSVLKKYNEKIIAYDLGLMLIKKQYPNYSSKLEHLRDLNHCNLEIEENQIYEIIKSIPKDLSIAELKDYFGKKTEEDLHKRFPSFSLFAKEDKIQIRSVILYGVSECYRARKFIDLLKNRDFEKIGELMNISHNGDRIVSYNYHNILKENLARIDHLQNYKKFNSKCSDEYMRNLYKENIPLEKVSGGYECSIKEIDFILDTIGYVSNQKHILYYGSQISGAGLGGCVMALVDAKHSKILIKELENILHRELGYIPEILISKAIMGISIIDFD
jgi:N-acetylgalactosamine kinase